MRLSPAEVRRLFAGDLDATTLDAHLAALEADPNWFVFRRWLVNALELDLHYSPTGERLLLRLEQSTDAATGRLCWRCTR